MTYKKTFKNIVILMISISSYSAYSLCENLREDDKSTCKKTLAKLDNAKAKIKIPTATCTGETKIKEYTKELFPREYWELINKLPDEGFGPYEPMAKWLCKQIVRENTRKAGLPSARGETPKLPQRPMLLETEFISLNRKENCPIGHMCTSPMVITARCKIKFPRSPEFTAHSKVSLANHKMENLKTMRDVKKLLKTNYTDEALEYDSDIHLTLDALGSGEYAEVGYQDFLLETESLESEIDKLILLGRDTETFKHLRYEKRDILSFVSDMSRLFELEMYEEIYPSSGNLDYERFKYDSRLTRNAALFYSKLNNIKEDIEDLEKSTRDKIDILREKVPETCDSKVIFRK